MEYQSKKGLSSVHSDHAVLRHQPVKPVDLWVPTPVPATPEQRLAFTQVQRQHQAAAVQPVLTASATLQRWTAEVQAAPLALQRQIAEVQAGLPEGAEQAAMQRQAARARPPTLPPAFQRQPSGQPSGQKPSISDWGQAYAFEMGRQTPDAQGMYASGPAVQVQRQIASGLAHSVRTSGLPAAQRYAEVGQTLARLQRQPLGAATVRGSLGLMPAGERGSIQRALDEANLALQREEAQDAQVEQLHALQRQLAEHQDQHGPEQVARRVRERQGGGEALPAAVQRHLEQGLNADLSRVRVHTDGEADRLAQGVSAKAFTSGQDIYFRRGTYAPNSKSGLELLAHEVTHTVQQAQGRVGPGVDPDAGLEQQARASGAKLAEHAPDLKAATPPVKSDLNADWKPPQFQPSPYAPSVYTPQAALQRVQDGAVGRASLNPLYSLHGLSMQRAEDPTIQRDWLGDAWNATGGKVISAGADAIKGQLASFVGGLPGYKPLCMAFGKDLVTGKAMDQNPNAILDALAGFVPGHMKDMIARLRETNAIPKAWAWFKGELAKLNLGGTLGDVLGALKSLDLGKAKTAITSRISGLQSLVMASARKLAEIVLDTVAAGLGPAAQQVIAQLKKSGDVIMGVIKNPGAFAKNMIAAVSGGFKSFASNAPRHLAQGLGQWLTGQSGIPFPNKLDFQGVFMTALTVLNLTYASFRRKLVEQLGKGGDEKVAKAEKTVDVVRNLASKGLHAAQEMKGSAGEVGNQVKTEVIGEIKTNLIQAAVMKLVSMFVPGGGFITALIGAFDTVKFLIDKGRSIMSLAMGVISSVGAIAAGNIGAAIGGVERSLAASIPLALGFLGKLLHIGNIGSKVRGLIDKLRGKLELVMNKVIQRVAAVINRVMGKGEKVKSSAKADKPGKKAAKPSKKAGADHDKKVNTGLADIPKFESKFLKNGKLNKDGAKKTAASVKVNHPIFRNVKVSKYDESGIEYEWFASHGKRSSSSSPPLVQLTSSQLKMNFWPRDERQSDGSNKTTGGRPDFRLSTKIELASEPGNARFLEPGTVTGAVRRGQHRRHIHGFDVIVETNIRELNGRTYESAQKHLASKGSRYRPSSPAINLITNKLKKFLTDEFNKTKNLWIGDGSENSSIGAKGNAAKERLLGIDPITNPKEYKKALKEYAKYSTDPAKGKVGGHEHISDINSTLSGFKDVKASFLSWDKSSLSNEGKKLKLDHNYTPGADYRAAEGDLTVLRNQRVKLATISKDCHVSQRAKLHSILKGIMLYEHQMVSILHP